MIEGPRFADVGANEHRMARLMELWMAVQTAARTYEGGSVPPTTPSWAYPAATSACS
jgi:hypothetical protein